MIIIKTKNSVFHLIWQRVEINLQLTQNVLEGKNCLNELFLVNTHLILRQMVAMGQFPCPLIGSYQTEVVKI